MLDAAKSLVAFLVVMWATMAFAAMLTAVVIAPIVGIVLLIQHLSR